MRAVTTLLFTLNALAIAACANAQPDAGHGIAEITVEETACFGFCPIYELSVRPDESYRLDAIRFTRGQGVSEGRFADGVFEAMASAVIEGGFFELPKRITPGEAACGSAPTDMPSLRLTVRREGEAQTLDWYHGCRNVDLRPMLEALRAAYGFEDLILPEDSPLRR